MRNKKRNIQISQIVCPHMHKCPPSTDPCHSFSQRVYILYTYVIYPYSGLYMDQTILSVNPYCTYITCFILHSVIRSCLLINLSESFCNILYTRHAYHDDFNTLFAVWITIIK